MKTQNNSIMDNDKNLPSTTGSWIIAALCALYFISPVNIIPDVPIVGQIDDLIIAAGGTLNLVQKYCERADSSLQYIVKTLKWIVILLGAVVIIVLALFAAFIVKLFQ